MVTGSAPKGWPKLDGGLIVLVWVGGTQTIYCSILEVCPWLGTILVPDNVGHSRGFPPTLEGNDEMGIEGWALDAESLGGLGTDITWEVIGVVIWPGLCGVTAWSIIGSMGLTESASEQYPTGTNVERDGVGPNISSICLSISCAQRMAARYFLRYVLLHL